MAHYSVAKAKDSLSSLIAKAQAGEEVIITSRGKPVAQLQAAASPTVKMPSADAYERLKQRRKQLPISGMTSVELLRAVYEDYPY